MPPKLLSQDGIIVAPGVYDVLSAIIAEQAGAGALYMTGNGQASSALGLPDLGLITLSEMRERIRATRARVSVPIIADADTGFGSLLMIQRAVQEYEAAGADAIQIEDQVDPKRCGHELGRAVVEVGEMVARITAAVQARRSRDFAVIARTDARTDLGLDAAIERGNAYARAGADVIFVESPESVEELGRAVREIDAPVLANMVETGRTPYLSTAELGALGVKVAIYPSIGFLAAAFAVRTAYGELLTRGRAVSLDRMLSLDEYHAILSFSDFAETSERLAGEGA
ncbi:isocitrate lyase/PEP mutase family protein [Baekduia soli]|uniref:Isocitrate lyase/PEP mutase family protein n=1 Tax=Baekduia soli TaxID=496014 RepID=A0A5B8U1R6_9ACTN|nr:isocitrate lyase/PEP mutase family protein [Baekduia soli]QEC46765.1 isocitrate lyase/PEP mutase family protein [Baekduia soli]